MIMNGIKREKRPRKRNVRPMSKSISNSSLTMQESKGKSFANAHLPEASIFALILIV